MADVGDIRPIGPLWRPRRVTDNNSRRGRSEEEKKPEQGEQDEDRDGDEQGPQIDEYV